MEPDRLRTSGDDTVAWHHPPPHSVPARFHVSRERPLSLPAEGRGIMRPPADGVVCEFW